MTYNFTVSPDFPPAYISGWYIFNTWCQKILDERIHLEMYDDFASQRAAIQEGKVDLIYANPFDAAMLVREKGFTTIAKPHGVSDEAVIATAADSSVQRVEDLQPGARIAVTDHPDVRMMGMIMLEPADLDASNLAIDVEGTYVLVAKRLLRGEADAGIFLARGFDEMSAAVRNQLRVLVRSQIQVIHHSLMLGPAMAAQGDRLREAVLDMANNDKGKSVLSALAFDGWESVDQEEAEFMIDLMDTLCA